MSWVRDFREFANDTSAHGVKYIFEGPYKVRVLYCMSHLPSEYFNNKYYPYVCTMHIGR